jgi:hypothetical protein
MVCMLHALLDFIYLAQWNTHNTTSLQKMEKALSKFEKHHVVFIKEGIHKNSALPHQHSLRHYMKSIMLFGALNGLCLSIIESKHIKAIKEPW